MPSISKPNRTCAANARYWWIAIGLFMLSLVSAPIVMWLQPRVSGEQITAAAINAAMLSGAIYLVGLVVALYASSKDDDCGVLRWVVRMLYAVPVVIVAACVAIG